MTTTLHDFGRESEEYGNIPFFYAFPIKFWVKKHFVMPDDVLTWCRNNCRGYYKVRTYTHKDSIKKGKDYLEKIVYVDQVYLASEDDASLLKLAFDLSDVQVRRPRLEVKKKPRRSKEEKALDPTSPEGIKAATLRHASANGGAVKPKRIRKK